MGNLNEQLRDLIEQLSHGNLKKMKKKLTNVLAKYKYSLEI